MYIVRDTPNGEGLELDGTAEENLEEPSERNSPTRSAFLQRLQLHLPVTLDTFRLRSSGKSEISMGRNVAVG